MPDPAGNGYLIGIQSFNNLGYYYEMQILDCNLYVQGKDAWIYTTGKCGTQGNTLWTTWQRYRDTIGHCLIYMMHQVIWLINSVMGLQMHSRRVL